MNFLLASDNERAEKGMCIHSCLYCTRVFNNHQALGGHVKVHQDGIHMRRSWNNPARSSNFMDIASNVPNSFSMGQPESYSGGSGNNLPTHFPRTNFPIDFSKFCLNESSRAHACKYSENNAGVVPSQFAISPYLSSVSGHAKINHSNPSPSAVFMPSANTVTAGFPVGPPLSFGPYGVSQFNTNELRTFKDGMPFYSGDALPNFQNQNLSNLSYPAHAISLSDSGFGSNQLPGLTEPNTVGSLPPGHGQCSIQNGAGKCNKSSEFKFEEVKKRCLGEVLGNSDMMNSSIRPQINSNVLPAQTEERSKKELLLFKDAEESFSELGISFDEKEQDEAYLDLSLHL